MKEANIRWVIGAALTIVWGFGAPALATTPLTTQLVASGLSRPIFVTAPPEDFGRLFIVEKQGIIKILNLVAGTVNGTAFLNIDAIVGGGTTQNSEQGLLGLAFHPDYAGNGLFYVNYTNNSGNTVVAQYQVSANPDIADAGSSSTVITYSQPQVNHNGGWIGFGPQGLLYISSGDGGGASDEGSGHTVGVGNGQDLTNNLLGKMLRIDVDGDDFPGDANRNYAIPSGNPFDGSSGDREIWAFGLRNPWRPSIDRVTGDLWIADVGQFDWEEINFQEADSPGGVNYGWRCREGAHDFNTTGDCRQTPFIEPIHEYSHAGGRCSISGGYVYRGCAIPDLRGTYFFADWCSAQIWSFRFVNGSMTGFLERTAELAPAGGVSIINIASFGEDAAGELYIVEQDTTGEVFKIVPAGPVDAPSANDYDNNGEVNLFDSARFVDCMTGPGNPPIDCPCDVFDQDNDDIVDLISFADLQNAFPG